AWGTRDTASRAHGGARRSVAARGGSLRIATTGRSTDWSRSIVACPLPSVRRLPDGRSVPGCCPCGPAHKATTVAKRLEVVLLRRVRLRPVAADQFLVVLARPAEARAVRISQRAAGQCPGRLRAAGERAVAGQPGAGTDVDERRRAGVSAELAG